MLLEAIQYDFEKKQMVRFELPAGYDPIFRLAAPLSGWAENEGGFFALPTTA